MTLMAGWKMRDFLINDILEDCIEDFHEIIKSEHLRVGRKTTFIDGYAVQWFSQLLRTKVMIYANVPNNKYVLVSEMTLPYVAEDVKTIEIIARGKIEELENEM